MQNKYSNINQDGSKIYKDPWIGDWNVAHVFIC